VRKALLEARRCAFRPRARSPVPLFSCCRICNAYPHFHSNRSATKHERAARHWRGAPLGLKLRAAAAIGGINGRIMEPRPLSGPRSEPVINEVLKGKG